MIWKIDFRKSTLAWLLAAAFVLGLGVHVVRLVTHRTLDLPLTVVENDPATRALKAKADSIMAARAISKNAPININTATAAEFESLDGIGPVIAARMVKYREENGPYSSVEDLLNVSGIGPKRFAAIQKRCVVDSIAN
jgi:comEA protein